MSTRRQLVGNESDIDFESARTITDVPTPIALFRTEDGTFFATEDSCTHEQWSLGEDSDLEGDVVICPLHMARYDLRTGEALCFPATRALRTFPVEVDDDGKVYVIV